MSAASCSAAAATGVACAGTTGAAARGAGFAGGLGPLLAGRAALVEALIAVGVELAAVLEHADLGLADEHDAAVAVLELGCLANQLLGHDYCYLPPGSSDRWR